MATTAAQFASPFAGVAAAAPSCGSAFAQASQRASFDLASLHNQPQQPRRPETCTPAFGHSASAKVASGADGLQAAAPLTDLDALMAAAACKPDWQAAQQRQAQQEAAARAAAVSGVLREFGAAPVARGCPGGIADAALAAISESGVADTFYVYDLGEVARLHATWVATLPRVAPFYAVKCNPEPGMIAMLNALGAGFDCASVQELQRAAAHAVPQDRIIFANPCKRPGDFRYAREHGVEYTTFDCVSELEKIAAGYPDFKCVLRIRCDDADAKINLGLKYGADLCDVPMLLETAKGLGLQVVGVSFHVGSGCQNVGVYADAISAAREAFDLASGYGFAMELLDIGGGFTAPYDETTASLFYETAAVINRSLARWFPVGCGVRVIAEPGRYFAETSATLFTTILGQRDSVCAGGQPFRDYWLSDGTYGSFRIQVAVDGLEPVYSVLRSPLLPPPPPEAACALLPCRLWGNSESDGDVVHKAALLPPLRDGDWLMFPFAGAYTICAASNYGGVRFTQPLKVFVFSADAVRDTGSYDVALGATQAAAAAHEGLMARAPSCLAPGATGLHQQRAASLPVASCGRCLSLLAGGSVVQLLQGLAFERGDNGCGGGGCNSSGSTDDGLAGLEAATAGSDAESAGSERCCSPGLELGGGYSGLEVLRPVAESPAVAECGGEMVGTKRRAACSSGGGSADSCASPAAVLLARGGGSGSDCLDCMSVASEGTAMGLGGPDVEFMDADVSSAPCIE